MDSFMRWVGGKRLLRKEIVKRIPAHRCYVEPFGGAAWVLFYKERSEVEVYNDVNGDLTTLFLQVKYHAEALAKELEFTLKSRKMFQLMRTFRPLTEIQRAARFLFLITLSFGAKGTHFGTQRRSGGGASVSMSNVIDRVREAQRRLEHVVIEGLDFEECIRRYDSEETFFYCDPPYFSGTGYEHVGVSFGEEDHLRLRRILGQIKGKFLLSYDDVPEVWALWRPFNIEKVERLTGINRKSVKKNTFRECLISNYEADR